MQDTRNHHAFGVLTVKDNVPAALHAAQAGTDIFAGATQKRMIGEHPATHLQITEVSGSLILTPPPNRVRDDLKQVGFCPPRETECSHG